MTSVLPSFEYPTSYPDILPGGDANRHPNINVFATMPVTRLNEFEAGNTVQLNIAGYVDPAREADVQRIIWARPRWMQGLMVTIDVLERLSGEEHPQLRSRFSRTLPADHLFSGEVVNHNANLAVRGVLHPARAGWLAFDVDAFGEKAIGTIADLKAEIGKISTADARRHSDSMSRTSTTTLPNGRLYS